MHAEIAGAGLSGLVLASALARTGWTVRVHEKSSELREIGAGIYLWENGLRALEAIGAYEAVTARAERLDEPTLRDHNGSTLQTEWLRSKRLYTVGRRHLHRSLVDTATDLGVEIRTESPIVGAETGGVLIGSDGNRYPADLVVGADGVYSRVRESLGLRTKMVDLHDGGGRHLIPRTSEDPVRRAIEQWNGGRRIGVVPCSPDETYIFLCCPADDLEGRQQQPFDPETWIESFPDFRSQLERIPTNGEGRWAPFYDVHVSSWFSGRAALLGDAAHAMSPNLGQAACVAMTNAVALALALRQSHSIDRALRIWESEQREMSDGVQKYSRIYGQVGTQWPNPLLGVRSSVVRRFLRTKSAQTAINFASEIFPEGELVKAP
ncbi:MULTISPECIES: FAD-dependent monooxygenase [Rhodococcus]|uniref:FAD-dependent monooxygenase n=1 Tax=Rhodococcus TaxID=1827 RepID=UPI000E753177|nr:MULTISPECIES: NAD(P)/FAD-dependent oxidoreductase [Rhodococcus]MCZ1075568.1 NAD(P)/FAD-dependent oxidoreductase [Rhodococcus sp. A5(2022)]QHG85327.1 FAD-dependent monooxygenase [Rhodococcus rhodochrous]QOH59588.1 FAD-dependent monooxygenase [Rhodococcus rhodochrous]TWH44503.1 2-polyprenyl-6-methoxyphenol hydroxylase-like FAD-dependent oxidoreductase [Rhodococcus rhodochrous J38]